jgi:aminocarboxymuconate-semialdehyde decarboxylase
VAAAGPEQVLLGSDYPFDMGSDLPVDEVQAAGLPAEDEDQVLGVNARRLGITAASVLTARPTA